MAALLCGISSVACEDPVALANTGRVYERRLLDKHVRESGAVCPVTGEAFDPEKDVVALKGTAAAKPRPTAAASIPGLLGLLQNEWDAVMLETHALQSALQASRQELSQTLYMHDAATRVVARLIKERDEARTELANYKQAAPQPAAAAAPVAAPSKKRDRAEGDEGQGKKTKGGVTDDVVNAMLACAGKLTKGRRKRPLPEGLATAEQMEKLELVSKFPLHTTSGASRGIAAVTVDAATKTAVTSGADGKVRLFDISAMKAEPEALAAHKKRVHQTCLLGKGEAGALGLLGTCSADKTCKLWRREGEGAAYSLAYTLDDHKDEVCGISLQPTGDYMATFAKDGEWIFWDLNDAIKLSTISEPDVGGFTCGGFHPDGLIMATGTGKSGCLIWDVKEQKTVAKFTGEASKGAVTSVSFSENGYYFATASSLPSEGCKLWDLRKLTNFMTLPVESPLAAASVVSFDASGQYLAVGCGKQLAIHGTSKLGWKRLQLLEDVPSTTARAKHAAGCSGIAFSPLADVVLACSDTDHNLRVYGAKE